MGVGSLSSWWEWFILTGYREGNHPKFHNKDHILCNRERLFLFYFMESSWEWTDSGSEEPGRSGLRDMFISPLLEVWNSYRGVKRLPKWKPTAECTQPLKQHKAPSPSSLRDSCKSNGCIDFSRGEEVECERRSCSKKNIINPRATRSLGVFMTIARHVGMTELNQSC